MNENSTILTKLISHVSKQTNIRETNPRPPKKIKQTNKQKQINQQTTEQKQNKQKPLAKQMTKQI